MITTKSPTALAGTPALSTSIFEQLGLDLPTAFRIFLKKSVEERGIPFSMRVENKNGEKW
ncbi:MAG: type II toxin-antitoxin system RelB/DinJ family antitoxin [Treponema sp.]|nr:type II toxin-antitoxin system RelB/DinJ family antitoxin [Treponema sp.]